MVVVFRHLPYNSVHGKFSSPNFPCGLHPPVLATFLTIHPINTYSTDHLPRLRHLHVLRFAYGAHGFLGLFLHSRD